ncbi:MAG: hypothetical protein QW575_04820 [Thermoproteota archaeon]
MRTENMKGANRVNTTDMTVAIRTAKILSHKTKTQYTLGVSSKRLIMLDFDLSKEKGVYLQSKVDYVIKFITALAKMLNVDASIYVTPHGLHAVLWKQFTEEQWRNYIVALIETANKEKELRNILDIKHLLASLRRGYATLRLNQICKLADVENGELKVYDKCAEVIKYVK